MVTYNPKDWIKLIIHLHKSDTMRMLLPSILLLGAITAGVSYAEQYYLEGPSALQFSVFHQISGFIISWRRCSESTPHTIAGGKAVNCGDHFSTMPATSL